MPEKYIKTKQNIRRLHETNESYDYAIIKDVLGIVNLPPRPDGRGDRHGVNGIFASQNIGISYQSQHDEN